MSTIESSLADAVSPTDDSTAFTVAGARCERTGKASFAVLPHHETSQEYRARIGPASIYEAEYHGILHALESFGELKHESAVVVANNELVISQLTGEKSVKDSKLKRLHDEVMDELENFTWVYFDTTSRREMPHTYNLAKSAIEKA